MKKTRVLFVTSPNEHCGIREYGEYLCKSLQRFPELEVVQEYNPDAHSLGMPEVDIIHVSHQAALHSSWREEQVKEYQKYGYVVCVTQHDTFEKWSIMLERGMPNFLHANALVLHEPVEGLMEGWKGEKLVEFHPGPRTENVEFYKDVEWKHENVYYFQQGVLPAADLSEYALEMRRWNNFVPTLGTVGFDFPWKNFDLGAKVTREAGWGYLVISPGMTEERKNALWAINPLTYVITAWWNAEEVVKNLSRCDATAFLYVTGNSGTSGAIRMGIAARKPLMAYCSRQNRDLAMNPAIDWIQGDEHARELLKEYAKGRVANLPRVEKISALADRDSWDNLAERYRDMWLKCLEDRN